MHRVSALCRVLLILPIVFSSQITAEEEPRVVAPGPPPADATVLFNGSDLSQWQSERGGEAGWDVKDGVATVNKTGNIATKQSFGDCQLHIEWATPTAVSGEG